MHWFKGAASATEDFGSGRAGLLVDWLMLQSSREFVGFLFPYHTNCRTKNVFFHVFFVVFLWRLVESEGMNKFGAKAEVFLIQHMVTAVWDPGIQVSIRFHPALVASHQTKDLEALVN